MQVQSTARGDRSRALTWIAAALFVLVVAFSFQGTRGIWDPDEGYYTNVALGMLQSGDWLVPRLSGDPFLDKPPLLYWQMAAAMWAFGINEWAVRAPHALWFAATALVLGALAGRWWGHRAGLIAAGVYALSLGPFLAANVLTPDTPLAFASALACYSLWRLEEESAGGRRLGWGVLLGGSLGLGFLAKGPAMLVLAAPLALYAAIRRRSVVRLVEPGFAVAIAVAAALALPWYGLVIARVPGALGYMLDNQMVGRLVTSEYARNAGPINVVLIYLPTLVVGALPWSGWWRLRWRRIRAIFRSPRVWLRRVFRRPIASLVLLWFCVPLAVFVIAQSRLPLYLLPLFAPLALLTARRSSLARRGARRHRIWLPAASVWVALMLALRVVAAEIEYDDDARALAAALRSRGVADSQLLVTINTKRNGLAFYGYQHLEAATTVARPYPFFVLAESLDEVMRKIHQGEARPLILVRDRQSAEVVATLTENRIPAASVSLVRGLSLVSAGSEPVSRSPAPRGLVGEGRSGEIREQ